MHVLADEQSHDVCLHLEELTRVRMNGYVCERRCECMDFPQHTYSELHPPKERWYDLSGTTERILQRRIVPRHVHYCDVRRRRNDRDDLHSDCVLFVGT